MERETCSKVMLIATFKMLRESSSSSAGAAVVIHTEALDPTKRGGLMAYVGWMGSGGHSSRGGLKLANHSELKNIILDTLRSPPVSCLARLGCMEEGLQK